MDSHSPSQWRTFSAASVTLPGRLIEVRMSMATVRLVCDVSDVAQPQQTVIGINLSVNTLLTATDGDKAALISGPEAKATVQWRHKRLTSCQQAQSQKTEGSRRWKRLQRRKTRQARILQKVYHRLRGLMRKAACKVVEAFSGPLLCRQTLQ